MQMFGKTYQIENMSLPEFNENMLHSLDLDKFFDWLQKKAIHFEALYS